MATKYYKCILPETNEQWQNGQVEFRVVCGDNQQPPQTVSPGPNVTMQRLQVMRCSDPIAQAEFDVVVTYSERGQGKPNVDTLLVVVREGVSARKVAKKILDLKSRKKDTA